MSISTSSASSSKMLAAARFDNPRFALRKFVIESQLGRVFQYDDLQTNPPTQVIVKESKPMKTLARSSEDVQKEANILRWLGKEPGAPLPAPAIRVDKATCGLGDSFMGQARSSPSNSSTTSSRQIWTPEPTSDQWKLLDAGRSYISELLHESMTLDYHFLVTPFYPGLDLFTHITESSKVTFHGLEEAEAKRLGRQICLAVLYLHSQSIAHLDLSVENICLTADGDVRVIDFGLAARHPHCVAPHPQNITSLPILPPTVSLASAAPRRVQDVSSSRRWCGGCRKCSLNASTLELGVCKAIERSLMVSRFEACAKMLAVPSSSSDTLSGDVFMEIDDGDHSIVGGEEEEEAVTTSDDLNKSAPVATTEPVLTAVSVPEALRRRLRFLCQPSCILYQNPGKRGYMSPEAVDRQRILPAWDAYKSDVFAIGVIMFSMLTGLTPFACADDRLGVENSNWTWLSSGKLLKDAVKPHNIVEVRKLLGVSHLGDEALDFFDACWRPQALRASVDELLNHPFLASSSPSSLLCPLAS